MCSDVTAGHVDIERDPDLAADPTRDTGQVRAADVGCQVAQSAEAVADWLRAGADSTDLRIIFSGLSGFPNAIFGPFGVFRE